MMILMMMSGRRFLFLLICIYYFSLLVTRVQKLRAVIKLFANLLSLIYEMSVVVVPEQN